MEKIIYGNLYENFDDLQKASKIDNKLIEIFFLFFHSSNSYVDLNSLGVLYEIMGNLKKEEVFSLKSLKIRENLY